MKRIGLAFVLLLLLSPMAFAVAKTVDLGPYKVSFDLGAPCSVEVKGPTESEDLAGGKHVVYEANIGSGSNFAKISLMDYNPTITCNLVETDKTYLKYALNTMGCQGVQVSERTIDGIPGALGYAFNSSTRLFRYTMRNIGLITNKIAEALDAILYRFSLGMKEL